MHLTAQMSNRAGWHLFVVLMGETRWPSYDWPVGSPIPTQAERDQALADLGYEVEPGADWSWVEGEPDECWDTSVLLMATAAVRPNGSGGGR
ncbi:DUF6303 family protein [Streptomyces sp. NPDC089799]|uniref:DUF6303 family protein n=1 Tax=Streptomyces sp. NPDC089799 TaxID=3155066 RepID=UPI0034378423